MKDLGRGFVIGAGAAVGFAILSAVLVVLFLAYRGPGAPINALTEIPATSLIPTRVPTPTPRRCDPADTQAVLKQISALTKREEANFAAAGKPPIIRSRVLAESLQIDQEATNIQPVTDCTIPVLTSFLLFLGAIDRGTAVVLDGGVPSPDLIQTRAAELSKAIADLQAANGN